MKDNEKYIKKKYELLKKLQTIVQEADGADISVREMSEKLGVTTGTFYYYFADKSELSWLWLSDLDVYMKELITPTFTEDEAANLMRFSLANADFNINRDAEKNIFINKLISETSSPPSAKVERYSFKILRKIFTEGIEKKQFLADYSPERLIDIYTASTRGIISRWVVIGQNSDLKRDLYDTTAFFLKGITHESFDMQSVIKSFEF